MKTSKDKKHKSVHALPQLLEPTPGPWSMEEVPLQDSKVELLHRVAHLPKPYTRAQQGARIHELLHVKHTPRDLNQRRNDILTRGDEAGKLLNSKVVKEFLYRLEETRIDWIAWIYYGFDLRYVREALAWDTKPVPDDDPVGATAWVLQLFWTILGSTTLPDLIEDAPKKREPDSNVKEYFDACWAIINEAKGEPFLRAVVQGCIRICEDPTNATRDDVTYELSCYFEDNPPEEEPEESEEEKEEQEEAEEEEKEQEKQEEENESGGIQNEPVKYDTWELHDHTLGMRRPNTKFRVGYRPTDMGTLLKYPQRWLLDKNIFGRRQVTQVAILVDLSGSMRWKNEDLMHMLDRMPSAWVGGYSSMRGAGSIRGRLCVYAKNGRFNKFTGIDPEMSGGNDIDIESLEYLAKMPGYKFWVSDGLVMGGAHAGKPHPRVVPGILESDNYMLTDGYIVDTCNKILKRSGIVRVPDAESMRDIIDGKCVMTYRSCMIGDDEIEAKRAKDSYWGRYSFKDIKEFYGGFGLEVAQPARYQL
jgi:hypothetical protein